MSSARHWGDTGSDGRAARARRRRRRASMTCPALPGPRWGTSRTIS